MESTSYVSPFKMLFFYLVTTGWIFDISLCENSINQSVRCDGFGFVSNRLEPIGSVGFDPSDWIMQDL